MKSLFYGVSVATIAGLLAGAAMHPVLRLPGAAEGPQMLGPESARRSGDYGAELTSYNGPPPDYVIGTDWLPKPYAGEFAEAQPEPAYDPTPTAPSVHDYSRLAYESLPPEPVRYPSQDGDILGGLRAEAPPAPPTDDEPPRPPA
jgi:hypothetical protein